MPWDFIANIGQQQNIGQGKSYWPSGPYTCIMSPKYRSGILATQKLLQLETPLKFNSEIWLT